SQLPVPVFLPVSLQPPPGPPRNVPLLHPRRASATLFPYTTLFRSSCAAMACKRVASTVVLPTPEVPTTTKLLRVSHQCVVVGTSDRKSTRLDSSHVSISHAVFGLKKRMVSVGARVTRGTQECWPSP